MATHGVCKLTGEHGTFVQAHLIPKALTKPAEAGLPLIQSGHGSRPTRRWSSWFDSHLVTQAGEDILAKLDSWAIPELRKHKLVWSGWGPWVALSDVNQIIPGTDWGARQVEGIDPKRLRLFFLSLLWRAAATERNEFSEIVMPAPDLERLRQMLVNEDPEPRSFYPAQLTQLSTMGFVHNQTPIADTKVIPGLGGQPERQVNFFRFYFEGLIAHIHREAAETVDLGNMTVGASSSLVISTVPFATSFQRENVETILAETARDWPHLMPKLYP